MKTLTDLRWRTAFALASPACWLDEWIESRLETRVPYEMPAATGSEHRLLYLACYPVPLRYRILRRLIVDPLAWLSEVVYPGWAEDERALVDYWRGTP